MPDTYTQHLEFTVSGWPADTFSVFRMTGREAISEPFRFELLTVANDCSLPLAGMAGQSATLTITRLGQTRKIHGMVAEMELRDATPQGQFVYRAVLVPRLQKLAMTRQNQIHGTTAPVSVREVLNDELTASTLKGAPASAVAGRLGQNDFELRLTQSYPQRDYIVQYEETDLAFVSRLCEHYGIFYFFTHDQGRDIAVFGDSRVAFPDIGGSGSIAYRTASGLANATTAAIYRFAGRSTVLPAQVCLRDYNYRLPNVTLEVDATVDPNGHGVVVEYGSHFRTPEEGRELARVRAQELSCRKHVFDGASDSVQLAAGTVFDLTRHFCDDFNNGYLVTWIEHEATQALPGIAEFAGSANETGYSNRFECLPQDVEFRPERKTPKPRMTGLSNAVVDAEGSGQRAEIDASGRYKIRQQFDQRGEAAGQSSRYTRKAEPYGGANSGMHFPLLKGTEVILACVNGDPDRPIIVGAMQNEQYPSVVNSRSNTKNRVRTTSGTMFEIDDGAASGSGGGSGAGSGATLAPQRALQGSADAQSVTTDADRQDQAPQPLAAQRAEADIQTSGDSSSSYARLHIPSGTTSYWRLGKATEDATEAGLTPDMSDMTMKDQPGTAGLFEYTTGARTSLVEGSSFRQVVQGEYAYIQGNHRMSAYKHNVVAKSEQYQLIGRGVVIESDHNALTDDSSPSMSAGAGEVMIKAGRNLNETIGGNYIQNISSHSVSRIGGDNTDVTMGAAAGVTLGSTIDLMMGNAMQMTAGFELQINLSAAVGIAAGAKADVFLGAALDVRAGPLFEWSSSDAVNLKSAEVEASGTSVSTKGVETNVTAVKSDSSTAKITTTPVQVTTNTASVTTGIQVSN